MTTIDRNCLSYWFPRIEAVGLPVPRTAIIHGPSDLGRVAMGEPHAGFDPLVERIKTAAKTIGYPVFLRTGLTSDKHGWNKTCFLERDRDIAQHVYNLIEFSEIADMMGLPSNVWAVREYLPGPAEFTAFKGEMPVRREFRYFVEDGQVVCRHSYWPADAIEDHSPSRDDWRERLDVMNHLDDVTRDVLDAMAIRAGIACGGSWSIDFLSTDRGWFLTDMAEAARSYHWPECQNVERAWK